MINVSLEGKRIVARFDYDPELIRRIKNIPGARFLKPQDGGPGWYYPLDMETCKAFRKEFSLEEARFDEALTTWGRQHVGASKIMAEIGQSNDAELNLLPERLPALYQSLDARPFQRVGVAFIGNRHSRPLVADEPGLGKTRQVIGGIAEAGMLDDPRGHLIIAPKTSLTNTWANQLHELQDLPVFVMPDGRQNREWLFEDVALARELQMPHWLVLGPNMVQLRKVIKENGVEDLEPQWPQLFDWEWATVTCDEVSKAAMQSPASMTARGLQKLKSDRRIAMDGTPVRGKPIKLWGILHWLHPESFTSKWRWAYQWLEIEENRFGKKAGRVKKDRQEEFDKMLAPYMLRRTKKEVAPDLPDKAYREIVVEMTPKQAKQYQAMADDAEMRIDEDTSISATSILAEYTRLKQFANAYCEVHGKRPDGTWDIRPTFESNKLPVLWELMEELGIVGDNSDVIEGQDDEEPEQIVIFSQFTQTVDMVCRWLDSKGVHNLKITGAVNTNTRNAAAEEFQSGKGARIIVMNTMAGGVSITLDMANTVVFLDETWTPDDQTQAEDRIHRLSRIHKVQVVRIISEDTIEFYIQKQGIDKSEINSRILDLWREGFRSIQREAA